MAEVLDDGEFWLPPQFLTDDDLFIDQNKAKSNPKNPDDGFGPFGFDLDATTNKYLFPYEFGYLGFSSDPGSPVGSLVGSTETESDEEDYLAGLTRQMAHYTLDDTLRGNDGAFAFGKPKGWGLSRLPQSTSCAVRRSCGCMQGSSRGSSTCQSRVSSPPGTWDLLYEAAGEVARMRMNEESYGGLNSSRRGLLASATRKFSHNVDVSSFYPAPQSLNHQKIQAAQFQILKQQQLMKQKNATIWGGQNPQQQQQQNLHRHKHNHVVQSRVRSNNISTNRPMGLSQSATCPPLQQQQQQQTHIQNGSGMRAVFLGNPTVKRQSAGTGVFLPRCIGAPTEPRKKPACSTALLPARVVQALNLNLDEIGQPQFLPPRLNTNFTADHDIALRLRSGGDVFGNQKQRNFRQHQGLNHEVGLPQEWTY